MDEIAPKPVLLVEAGRELLPAQNPALVYLASLPSPTSRVTMTSVLNSTAHLLGAADLWHCAWPRMRRPHVQAVLRILGDQHKAPATINTYLAALKGVALEAWNLGAIDTDTYEHLKTIKSVRGSRLPKGRALARGEVTALLACCDGDDSIHGRRDAAIISLLLGCGLRRAEVVSLDLANVLVPEQAVKLIGKGNKQRLAYLPPETWTRLDIWLRNGRPVGPGPLFVRVRRFNKVTADRLTSQAVYHILEVRRRRAGLDPCAPHDLRRTFASSMLDNSEDIMTVKDAMGHASITTTQRYDRRPQRRLRAAGQRIRLTGDGQNMGIPKS